MYRDANNLFEDEFFERDILLSQPTSELTKVTSSAYYEQSLASLNCLGGFDNNVLDKYILSENVNTTNPTILDTNANPSVYYTSNGANTNTTMAKSNCENNRNETTATSIKSSASLLPEYEFPEDDEQVRGILKDIETQAYIPEINPELESPESPDNRDTSDSTEEMFWEFSSNSENKYPPCQYMDAFAARKTFKCEFCNVDFECGSDLKLHIKTKHNNNKQENVIPYRGHVRYPCADAFFAEFMRNRTAPQTPSHAKQDEKLDIFQPTLVENLETNKTPMDRELAKYGSIVRTLSTDNDDLMSTYDTSGEDSDCYEFKPEKTESQINMQLSNFKKEYTPKWKAGLGYRENERSCVTQVNTTLSPDLRKNYRCPLCPRSSNFKTSLRRHIRNFHKDEADALIKSRNWYQTVDSQLDDVEYSQQIPKRKLSLSESFARGGLSSSRLSTKRKYKLCGNRFKCFFCSQTYEIHKVLLQHEREVHGVPYERQQLFACMYCGETFRTFHMYESHLRKFHPKEKSSSPTSQQETITLTD